MKKLLSALLVLSLCCSLVTVSALADWICPSCGHENRDKANFCGSCRAAKPEAQAMAVPTAANGWICGSCGMGCPDEDAFCIVCGADRNDSCMAAYVAPQVEKNTVSFDPAQVLSLTGSISANDSEVKFSYTAQVTGRYRFWIAQCLSGVKFQVQVFDSRETRLKNEYLAQDDGASVDFTAGETYVIKVNQYRNYGDFVLNLGQAVPVADVTGYRYISDSVCFTEQVNRYVFTAPYDGVYGFFIRECNNGLRFNVKVTDAAGYEKCSGYLEQNDILNATLAAGQVYTVSVTQYRGKGDYVLGTAYAKDVAGLNGCEAFADTVNFSGETIRYSYVCAETGSYTFTLTSADSGFRIGLAVLDRANYSMGNGYLEKGNKLTVSLTAGQVYVVGVQHSRNTGDFTVTIKH